MFKLLFKLYGRHSLSNQSKSPLKIETRLRHVTCILDINLNEIQQQIRAFSWYSVDCHAIYIITSVLKVETDIITSIAAIGLCVILVIMYVEITRIAAIGLCVILVIMYRNLCDTSDNV